MLMRVVHGSRSRLRLARIALQSLAWKSSLARLSVWFYWCELALQSLARTSSLARDVGIGSPRVRHPVIGSAIAAVPSTAIFSADEQSRKAVSMVVM
jgi:hypothetical protein